MVEITVLAVVFFLEDQARKPAYAQEVPHVSIDVSWWQMGPWEHSQCFTSLDPGVHLGVFKLLPVQIPLALSMQEGYILFGQGDVLWEKGTY